MQRKILAATLLVIIFSTACAGSSNTVQPTNYPTSLATPEALVVQTPTFEPVRIVIGIQPFASNLPLYIAHQEGYFAEQGIETELVPIVSQLDLVPAIVLSEIDVTGSVINPAQFRAIQETPGFRYVADKGYLSATACPFNAWVISEQLAESGTLDDLANLKDITFGFQQAVLINLYALDYLLEPTGLTRNDMQISEVPTDLAPEALRNNAIDITTMVEPSITRAINADAGVIWRGLGEYMPEMQLSTLWYGPSLIQENRDAGNRFMVAYLKAVRQYNEGKTDRNVELMAEFTRLDLEVALEMCWPTFRAAGDLNFESMLDFQEWAVDNGYLDTIVPVETFWDGGFIEYALTVLGN